MKETASVFTQMVININLVHIEPIINLKTVTNLLQLNILKHVSTVQKSVNFGFWCCVVKLYHKTRVKATSK